MRAWMLCAKLGVVRKVNPPLSLAKEKWKMPFWSRKEEMAEREREGEEEWRNLTQRSRG